jgi:endonuclease YncB( thermonuclease family)
MLRRFFILAALIAAPAAAGIMTPEPVSGPVRVIDGDTVRLQSGETVRIYNIDAPETHQPRCPAEAKAGAAATVALSATIERGGVMVSRCEPATGRCQDRYHRTLASLSNKLDGDLGERLVAVGLALPWQSGSTAHEARRRHWCGR